jgi:general stress protein YciG
MAGTIQGGLAAAKRNKANDPDFYKKIGRAGGKLGHTGGFASDMVGTDGLTGKQRAGVAGALGGRISRHNAKRK